jgi:hypothetical protein
MRMPLLKGFLKYVCEQSVIEREVIHRNSKKEMVATAPRQKTKSRHETVVRDRVRISPTNTYTNTITAFLLDSWLVETQ